jgi:hypothetical protein
MQRVAPHQFTVEHIDRLHQADVNGPAFNKLSMGDVVRKLWLGEFLLYDAGKGTFLFEINEGSDGTKRLNIVRAAGEGITLKAAEIAADLQHIAREFGCVAIETIVYSPKLARALTRGGAKQEAIVVVLELENG